MNDTFDSSTTKRSKALIMDSSESSSKVKSEPSSSSIHPEEHIYSQDPLIKSKEDSASFYERIDYDTLDRKNLSNQ